eukprot:scaffold131792_cov20-Tisochrysis_lutea.AAC.1
MGGGARERERGEKEADCTRSTHRHPWKRKERESEHNRNTARVLVISRDRSLPLGALGPGLEYYCSFERGRRLRRRRAGSFAAFEDVCVQKREKES